LGLDARRQGRSNPNRSGSCSVNFRLVGSLKFEVGGGNNFGFNGGVKFRLSDDCNNAQYGEEHIIVWIANERTQRFADQSAEFGEWGEGCGWVDGVLVTVSGYSFVN
jgi:hypothetical protein